MVHMVGGTSALVGAFVVGKHQILVISEHVHLSMISEHILLIVAPSGAG